MSRSSLSAGEIIYSLLTNDETVMSLATKVYPVVVDEATLPYVVYRRSSLQHDPVKGQRGADTVTVEVVCYSKDYTSGVELAEAVRDALDGAQMAADDITMRSCYLSDSAESWADDAYIQDLIFTIKI